MPCCGQLPTPLTSPPQHPLLPVTPKPATLKRVRLSFILADSTVRALSVNMKHRNNYLNDMKTVIRGSTSSNKQNK